jgi:rhodanese-related sulfurtransferase
MLHLQSTLALYSLLLLLLQPESVSALQLPTSSSSPSLITTSSGSVQTAATATATTAVAVAAPNTSGYAAYCAARQQQLQPVALDLRTAERYAEQHISGSCSVPLSELVTRLYELPAPFGAPLQLIGGCAERASARNILEQGGWNVGAELDLEAERKTGPKTEAKTELQPVEGAHSRLVLESGAQSPLIWRCVEFN